MSPITLRKQKQQSTDSQSNDEQHHPDINNNENQCSNINQIRNCPVKSYGSNEDILEIPFPLLAIPTATIQISSLVFCLSWSIKFNFHESTATHCRVENYLPSLSATLDFTPQREIWRACVCLTGFPRFLISYLYFRLIFKSKFLLLVHWLEIVSLIGLSIIDSVRYFPFHAICVGIFLITSVIHMGLVYIDYYDVGEKSSSLSQSLRSKFCSTRQVKQRIAWINLISIVTALYLYNRHNQYCEPGIYSLFSFLEYIVIVANIVYHLQACTDLGDYTIKVGRNTMGISTVREPVIS